MLITIYVEHLHCEGGVRWSSFVFAASLCERRILSSIGDHFGDDAECTICVANFATMGVIPTLSIFEHDSTHYDTDCD